MPSDNRNCDETKDSATADSFRFPIMVAPIKIIKYCPYQELTSAVDLCVPKVKIKLTNDHYLKHNGIDNAKKESSSS